MNIQNAINLEFYTELQIVSKLLYTLLVSLSMCENV